MFDHGIVTEHRQFHPPINKEPYEKYNFTSTFLMIRRKNCRVLGVGIFNRRAPQVKGVNPKTPGEMLWISPTYNLKSG